MEMSAQVVKKQTVLMSFSLMLKMPVL